MVSECGLHLLITEVTITLSLTSRSHLSFTSVRALMIPARSASAIYTDSGRLWVSWAEHMSDVACWPIAFSYRL